MHSEPVQTALKRLRQANNGELAALQVVGKADAALDHLDIDRGALQNPSGNAASSLLTRIVPVLSFAAQVHGRSPTVGGAGTGASHGSRS
jgi:hypothetical protein